MVRHRPLAITTTLVVIHDDQRVLLGLKKRGFGSGRWNGFGGKVKAGETLKAAAERELFEEACVSAGVLREAGCLVFYSQMGESQIIMHIFRGAELTGEPRETEEMRPAWFSHEALPFAMMWPDDQYWLPRFLQGQNVTGTFRFGKEEKIIRHNLIFA